MHLVDSVDLKAPPSSTFRSIVASGFGILIAIPLSIWVNLITAAPYGGLMDLVATPKWYFLASSAVLILANLYALYVWDIQEKRWNTVVLTTKAKHNSIVQKNILENYCSIIKYELKCPVSARVFEAKSEKEDIFLYQAPSLFIENERFPQETAYTSVPINHPKFVHSRAFRERAPIYEILADNHSADYPPREKLMVEPTQRWVIAAPIRQLDVAGRVRDDLLPRGVVVFYGKTLPSAGPGSPKGDIARAYARDAADSFVYLPIGGTDS